jgi:hypothetical protein
MPDLRAKFSPKTAGPLHTRKCHCLLYEQKAKTALSLGDIRFCFIIETTALAIALPELRSWNLLPNCGEPFFPVTDTITGGRGCQCIATPAFGGPQYWLVGCF